MGKISANHISDKVCNNQIVQETLTIAKTKQSSSKNGQRTLVDIQRRHTNGQQVHEKVLNITST